MVASDNKAVTASGKKERIFPREKSFTVKRKFSQILFIFQYTYDLNNVREFNHLSLISIRAAKRNRKKAFNHNAQIKID